MDRTYMTVWIIGAVCILGALLAIIRYSFASSFIPHISYTKPVQQSSKITIQPTPRIMPTKIYSSQDVANHNTIDACWIVIDKYVYDISGLLKQYKSSAALNSPAGGQICGTDQSNSFSKMLGQNGLNVSQLNSFFAQYAIGKTE